MNGIRIRLETKPGKSRASAGSLPRSRASWTIDAAVSSDVCTARITSTSLRTGTGLKKCIPMTRSGRRVTAASDVIECHRGRLQRCGYRLPRMPAAAEHERAERKQSQSRTARTREHPAPREARRADVREPPGMRVHRQPRPPALPVHGELLTAVEQREPDIPHRRLIAGPR